MGEKKSKKPELVQGEILPEYLAQIENASAALSAIEKFLHHNEDYFSEVLLKLEELKPRLAKLSGQLLENRNYLSQSTLDTNDINVLSRRMITYIKLTDRLLNDTSNDKDKNEKLDKKAIEEQVRILWQEAITTIDKAETLLDRITQS